MEQQPQQRRIPARSSAATRPRPAPSTAPPLPPSAASFRQLLGSSVDRIGLEPSLRSSLFSGLRSVAWLCGSCVSLHLRITQSPIPRKRQPQQRAPHFIKQEGGLHPFTPHRRYHRCCRCRRRKRAPRGPCTPGTAVACRPSTTGSTRPGNSAWDTRRTPASLVPGTLRSADA